MKQRWLLLLLSMVFCSCETMVYIPPVGTKHAYTIETDATLDRTWSAVIEMLADTNVPITVIEKASGIVVAHQVVQLDPFIADHADFGRFTFLSTKNMKVTDMFNEPRYYKPLNATCEYNIYVKQLQANRCEVRMTTNWYGTIQYYDSIHGGWPSFRAEGLSTGTFEKQKLSGIEARLKQDSP